MKISARLAVSETDKGSELLSPSAETTGEAQNRFLEQHSRTSDTKKLQ